MNRNNSTTKNKRTNKHSSSSGRRSASDLRDQELLASAWARAAQQAQVRQQRLLPG